MLRKNVLRRKKDFDLIYRNGKSIGDRYIVLFYRKNGMKYSRTAFLASKKVGNSVKRNRARRLMKESLRLSDYKLVEGYDYIFIARNTINGVKCQDVSRSVASAVKRAEVIKGEKVR
ncbi:MAG: ribonuclease P protein component [Peptostreptococcaceae bacterium]|nr:ribonuclease P protein component [Peptostreptococcaceae bacterium]MDY5739430.1 ribonuclease P protein component [Anaerovoracaceae bacterium]